MQLQNVERDFNNDFLSRTCSAATNLSKSLGFNPIRCATKLCLFTQTRNGSVATHFLLFSSTATNTATSECVAVPERIGQNEEPASRNGKLVKNLFPLQNCA